VIAADMPELTEIDATKKVSFEEPKKDAADSDSDSSNADAAAGKGAEGASAVTAEDLSNKARQSRGEKKARKIISKLGLKQVCVCLCGARCNVPTNVLFAS
jgi:nascent polypeptide-associated complex subunit alpha